jgi:hypothetical protein
MSSLIDIGNANWFRFLSRWALLTAITYLGLILAFLTLVIPASQNSPLPETYFELVAATRSPIFYRLTIGVDVITNLALGGLLITLAALFAYRAPIRSTFIAAGGVGMLSGFIGACFRLAGTNQLAASYLTAAPNQQAAILQSYLDLLRLVNILFSAGGLMAGIAMLLAASVAWSMAQFPRWSNVLLALSAVMQISKAVIELATGADLGLLGLLGSILLIGALFGIARTFWRRVPAGQRQLAP